jgi:hypothetical protein
MRKRISLGLGILALMLLTGAVINPTVTLFNLMFKGRSTYSKLSDVVSVKDFGATGDGSTDDTAAIQLAANAAAGGTLFFPKGTYLVCGTSITLSAGTMVRGQATVKGKASCWTAASGAVTGTQGALFSASSANDVTIRELELDANYDNGGAYYGVYFSAGSRNTAANLYIHDTGQACIWSDSETRGTFTDNRLINCGRNFSTNDHALMFGSNTTAAAYFVVRGNFVSGAHRKGITSYAQSPGTITHVVIDGNIAINGGLAGVFVSAGGVTPDATLASDIAVTKNITSANTGANIQFSGLTNGVLSGNIAVNSVSSYSIYVDTVLNSVIANNSVDNSSQYGIGIDSTASTNTGLAIIGNVITRSNQSSGLSQAGLSVLHTTFSLIASNDISDSTAKQVYAIIEGTGSDNNTFRSNILQNASTSLLSLTGANSKMDTGLSVDLSGNTKIPGILSMTGSGANAAVQATGSNTSLTLTGNRSAADTGGDLLVNSSVARTGGKIIRVLNNGTEKASWTFDGSVVLGSVTFANLAVTSNGQIVYCSDCTVANPCASGGSGAVAKRINSAWVCN